MNLGSEKTSLVVEAEAFEGVRRIAAVVAQDIEAVTGVRPEVVDRMPREGQAVLCLTLGHSPLAQQLMDAGVLDKTLTGKREVYQIRFAEIEGREVLVICGSDKRGTIYGMFHLSESIGVSPLCYWGDVGPQMRSCIALGREIETISKEPSVKYRGFFINDEFPCFGNWYLSHYGAANAQCYEQVFIFLLRMKGNYLWPAMWAASFPLDGPGSANEELADLYGVVMGYSHHEPCLRASEEWDKVKGEKYGTAWNFYTNEQGLTRYWEDALKRSGGYENIITIGMRGERDSSMLGDDSSLAENISLLKRIITTQRGLIEKHVPRKAKQMLALYKEVERYFYGDAQTEGLRSWRELDDVLFLLCEDNHGHLRTVPPKDLRSHPGGWGMYYHFDYHGGPVSYEWVDSTPLAQTWEQMTQAWEYGIRDLWIVNVGDLKLHEVPLTYFMALAYDYERWGSGNPQSAQEYTRQWAANTFPGAGEEIQQQIGEVLRDYIGLNSLRRPESCHAGIYHPCHYEETDRMIALADALEEKSTSVFNALRADQKDAYYSMIHFSAMASANLLKMHLYAGKNQHYADQGKTAANRYAELTEACIAQDKALAAQFGAFKAGKWDSMQLAPHIGFTKWNEDDCRYPVLCKVTPMDKAILKVNRADRGTVAAKNYGTPICIPVHDFRYAGCREVRLEISNGGSIPFSFTVAPRDGEMPGWLTVTPASAVVTDQVTITLHCQREKLPQTEETCVLHISDGDATVAVEVSGKAVDLEALPPMTFVNRDGVIAMLAEHYQSKHDVQGAGFCRIGGYGKYGSGMKVLPSTAEFENDAPSLTYSFVIEEAGNYQVELLTAPNNSVEIGRSVNVRLEAAGTKQVVELVSAGFRAGENSDPVWCAGVLEQIHTAAVTVPFAAGIQTLTIGAMEPGVVLEKIVISRNGTLPSYLGPEETTCHTI